MLKTLLLSGLFFASLLLQGCNSAEADNTKRQNEQSVVQEQCCNSVNANNSLSETKKVLTDSQTVSFKGVSFNYNPQIFGDVKSEEIAESPMQDKTEKPGENFPKHIAFYFEIPKLKNEGRLLIIPIEDYRKMYAVSNYYTESFNQELKDLRKVLMNKNFRRKGQMPFIPFYDASQTFLAKVKSFPFQNGKGIFFLTQYDIETSLVNNEGLTYIFQGISIDGEKYFLAEFPMTVSFLPKSYSDDEFEGYKLSELLKNEADSKLYQKYTRRITKRLEDLKSNEFEPNLNSVEEIIASLKIEK